MFGTQNGFFGGSRSSPTASYIAFRAEYLLRFLCRRLEPIHQCHKYMHWLSSVPLKRRFSSISRKPRNPPRNSFSLASQRHYWSYFIRGKLDIRAVQRECHVSHPIKTVIWPLKTLAQMACTRFKAILGAPTAIKAVESGRNQSVFRVYLD